MMTLIDGFNTMIRNLKAHEQELAEMSKKVAWTEMARKVAHEIKNPSDAHPAVRRARPQGLRGQAGGPRPALKESMSYIIGEVENLRRIAQEFMEIARDTTVRKEPLDLPTLLEEALQPYRRLLAERIRFKLVAEGRGISGPRRRGQAQDRVPQRHRQRHRGHRPAGRSGGGHRPQGTGLRIVVRDTGPGMSRETAERIFDPYFSTKDAGTGLGLPITKKIIEEHGGDDPRRERTGPGHDGDDRAPGRRLSVGILAGFLAE